MRRQTSTSRAVPADGRPPAIRAIPALINFVIGGFFVIFVAFVVTKTRRVKYR